MGFVSDPNPPAVVYGNTTDDYSFTFFSELKSGEIDYWI